MGDYTRLVILSQRDQDEQRRQVAARHIANLAPYAHAGADAAAGSVIAQHYQAEAAQLAGDAPAGPIVIDHQADDEGSG